MSVIDISGINKALLLSTLFNSSKQQGMGFMDKSGARAMTLNDAENIINEALKRDPDERLNTHRLCFDYLRGRVMKIDISSNVLDPYLYDRDNGGGAAARAVDSIRG